MSEVDVYYAPEFKLAAVQRMETAPNVMVLANELGVSRGLLYIWLRKYRAHGAAGLHGRGRPRKQVKPPDPRMAVTEPAARIAELERKVGQQALELDFFRAALKHFAEPQQRNDDAPETGSTP